MDLMEIEGFSGMLYWKKTTLRSPNLVIGGELNFNLGAPKFWGPKAVLDPLAGYFLNLLESIGLLDIHPNSLKVNNKFGEGRISKRLDIFTLAS